MLSETHLRWLRDCGHPPRSVHPISGGRSPVWRLETASVTLVLKQSRRASRFQAERDALVATAALPETPTLVASSSEHQLLLTQALPGLRPRRVNGHMLVAAGAFLRRLHALPVSSPGPADPGRVLRRAERAATRARGAIDGVVSDTLLAQLHTHADKLGPKVRIHGDFGGRNWLWGQGQGVLCVVDWELSREGAAFSDYALVGQGLQDPALRAAFFAACGRTLSAGEEALVDCLYGIELLTALGQAHEAGRAPLAETLRKMLSSWR